MNELLGKLAPSDVVALLAILGAILAAVVAVVGTLSATSRGARLSERATHAQWERERAERQAQQWFEDCASLCIAIERIERYLLPSQPTGTNSEGALRSRLDEIQESSTRLELLAPQEIRESIAHLKAVVAGAVKSWPSDADGAIDTIAGARLEFQDLVRSSLKLDIAPTWLRETLGKPKAEEIAKAAARRWGPA